MIPAIQLPVHPPPCVEGVPGDEVVCSLVVMGDVVGGGVGAIVVAIRMISGIKEHAEFIGFNIMIYMCISSLQNFLSVESNNCQRELISGILLRIGHLSTYE